MTIECLYCKKSVTSKKDKNFFKLLMESLNNIPCVNTEHYWWGGE